VVILQSAFTLPVPIDEAFDLLVDPIAIAAALPGARPAARGGVEGELDVDAGFATVTVRGRVEPGARDRAAGALSFRVAANELDGGADLRAGGEVRLRDAAGMTAVAIELEVEAGGRLAAGGDNALEATMRRLVDGLATGLRARAAGEVAPTASDDVDARAELEAEDAEAVGYGWMVTAPAAAEAPAPAWTLVPDAVAAPPRPAPPPPPPAMPGPAARAPRRVPGRVEIVTAGPVPAAGIPVGDGPRARLHAVHRTRPWLMPAVLLGLIALVLLLRRRRRAE
jgi:carbon monoxide dehydrogenase subunit G